MSIHLTPAKEQHLYGTFSSFELWLNLVELPWEELSTYTREYLVHHHVASLSLPVSLSCFTSRCSLNLTMSFHFVLTTHDFMLVLIPTVRFVDQAWVLSLPMQDESLNRLGCRSLRPGEQCWVLEWSGWWFNRGRLTVQIQYEKISTKQTIFPTTFRTFNDKSSLFR